MMRPGTQRALARNVGLQLGDHAPQPRRFTLLHEQLLVRCTRRATIDVTTKRRCRCLLLLL